MALTPNYYPVFLLQAQAARVKLEITKKVQKKGREKTGSKDRIPGSRTS